MGIDIPLNVLWIVAAVIFGIIEAVTMGLTTIWFAGGALIAWVFSAFNAPLILQVVAFLVSSAVLVYFTRPLAKKYLKIGHTRTNASSLIGEIGIVTQAIDPINGTGQVKVNGQTWSAKSQDKKAIEESRRVEVLEIQGVKLVVKKIK